MVKVGIEIVQKYTISLGVDDAWSADLLGRRPTKLHNPCILTQESTIIKLCVSGGWGDQHNIGTKLGLYPKIRKIGGNTCYSHSYFDHPCCPCVQRTVACPHLMMQTQQHLPPSSCIHPNRKQELIPLQSMQIIDLLNQECRVLSTMAHNLSKRL